jgi:hypothetical protein
MGYSLANDHTDCLAALAATATGLEEMAAASRLCDRRLILR